MIHVARSVDASALSAVARATFLESFADIVPFGDIALRADTEDSESGIAARLESGAVAWLARHADTDAPVGFAMNCAPELPEVEAREDDRELKRLSLLHRFHGTGTGAALLAAAVEEARQGGSARLLLGVYAQNPTVAWYRRRGFAPVGTRVFRVGNRYFDDLILALDLT